MRQTLCLMVLLLACSSANATLVSVSGGLAYYDTATNLTWVADANLAATNDFGVTGINSGGMMNWAAADAWIAGMNSTGYLGVTAWRLPTVTDTGTSGCDYAYTGTDCGYNVDLGTGEMARMFYSTLGNTGAYNTSGTLTGCSGGCLTNAGPFSIVPTAIYWSGTAYAPDTGDAWYFDVHTGQQNSGTKGASVLRAWAVSSGNTLNAAIPVPPAVWLFGSALGLIGVMRRKISS